VETLNGERIQIPEGRHGRPARLVTSFGRLTEDGKKRVHYVFDAGKPDYVESVIDGEQPVPSIVANVPAASWYEREVCDQFKIEFRGSPDSRPLLFHDNWPADFHPMLDLESGGAPTPSADDRTSAREYRFLKVEGAGIVEVAVGPVHAGIIEPGHFRFSVMGDTVLHLELRHFYTHKGTERLFQGRHVMAGSMLAESVSGDNCFSHTVAYCQAVEAAFRVDVPRRAEVLRLIGLEVERLIAHVGDVGALCNDVGFSVAAARAASLKEDLLQASTRWIGTRYWRGISVPGGFRADVNAAATADFLRTVDETARRFADLARIIRHTPSVQNRFDFAGILKRQAAEHLGVVGPVARASGVNIDVRRDHPYGAYSHREFKVPFIHYGDVMARARIRMEEAAESARLIEQALVSLPAGEISNLFDPTERVHGHSAVESPRGELFYWVEASSGLITRCHIKSPSFQNWPALPLAVAGNVIADFPLINKSFNLSYSGCDR
jgi:Ni,Fe-hydrogenase III large subunit